MDKPWLDEAHLKRHQLFARRAQLREKAARWAREQLAKLSGAAHARTAVRLPGWSPHGGDGAWTLLTIVTVADLFGYNVDLVFYKQVDLAAVLEGGKDDV